MTPPNPKTQLESFINGFFGNSSLKMGRFCERDFGDMNVLRSILEAAGIVGLKDRTPQVQPGGWKTEYARRKGLTVDLGMLQQRYSMVEETLEG